MKNLSPELRHIQSQVQYHNILLSLLDQMSDLKGGPGEKFRLSNEYLGVVLQGITGE